MSGFTFNSESSDDYNLAVKTIKPPTAKPRYKYVQVIGKNGTYKFPDGLDDVVIEIEATITGEIGTRRATMRMIRSWLTGEASLTLDYDNTVSYTAVLADIDTVETGNSYEIIKLVFRGVVEDDT